MKLKAGEYYRATSLEDRCSVIEEIYDVNPDLVSYITYRDRMIETKYPKLMIGEGNKITGFMDNSIHPVVELSREEFIHKAITKPIRKSYYYYCYTTSVTERKRLIIKLIESGFHFQDWVISDLDNANDYNYYPFVSLNTRSKNGHIWSDIDGEPGKLLSINDFIVKFNIKLVPVVFQDEHLKMVFI